jgi:5-methylcytosine-specific restriction protein B
MPQYSKECLAVLELLKTRKNVLITGAPACGKTTLMSEIASAFKYGFLPEQVAATTPTHVPGSVVGLPRMVPAQASTAKPIPELPSPSRKNREVFRTVFEANSKPRDFLSGLIPKVGAELAGLSFAVTEGKLVVANKHAEQTEGAALLLIDELNRGPAVQLFGNAIVALESDKRLSDDDQVVEGSSFPFEIMGQDGVVKSCYLSSHLYIVAAMNQADVSVEPLDVAFVRRWTPFPLFPAPSLVRAKLNAVGPDAPLGTQASTPGEVVEALVRAWESVNEQIEIGRGPEFKIGHGIIFSRATAPLSDVNQALDVAVACWRAIMAHVEEVFYGDPFGVAATLRAGTADGVYKLVSMPFGQEQRHVLRAPPEVNRDNIYSLLQWVGRPQQP